MQEEMALRVAARAAEDDGDFVGALRLVRLLPPGPERRRWVASLDEARDLDQAADADRLARWLVQPALRFGLRPATVEVFTRYADEVLRAWGVPGAQRADLAVARALRDPLVADAGLFDGGVFDRYREHALGGRLRSYVMPLRAWRECRVTALEVLTEGDDRLEVRDLLSGRVEQVLLSGEVVPSPLVYGRLLPTLDGAATMFALPPLAVDRLTAGRVTRAVARRAPVAERLRAVVAGQRRAAKVAA